MDKTVPYQKPNLIAYGFAKLISGLFCIQFNNHVTYVDGCHITGPAVVLGNHLSGYDQFISGSAVRGRMTYVVGDAVYHTLPCSRYFRRLHLLHKQQAFTTVSNLRQMKNVIANGGILMLYPTGVCSLCGGSSHLPAATGKFLKKLGADVYVIREHGMYLSSPKWQDKIRRGKVETEVFRLFPAEELKSLTAEEIHQKVSEALDSQDYQWQETRHIRFRNGDQIAGLENVLYDCPSCGAHFSMEHRDNQLVCNVCGFSEHADEYGFLHSEDKDCEIRYPSVWHEQQKNTLKQNITKDKCFSHKVTARIEQLCTEKRKFVKVGSGTVHVDLDYIQVILENGERIYKEVTERFAMLPMMPGKYFDLQNGETIFRCFPEVEKEVSYFSDIVESIHELSSCYFDSGFSGSPLENSGSF